MSAERKCGACTLCCTALAVPELDKPNGVPCVHLTPTGCGIYEDRPESCRQLECAWLQGAGSYEHRPDRTGAVIVPERDESEADLGPALVVYSDPNGRDPARSGYVRRMVTTVVRDHRGTVVFVSGDSRRITAHPHSQYARKAAALDLADESRETD